MKEFMEKVADVTGLIAKAGLWVSGFGVVLMTLFIAMQVFWRYVLNDSLQWTEPASVMIMGWFIFLGAAVGIREGYHLSFDVMLYLVPRKVQLIFYSISDLVVTAFGVGMVYFGSQLAAKTAGNSLPGLGISGAFDFLPIVVGGILLILFCIERIARRLAGLPTSRIGDDVDAELAVEMN